MSGSTCIRTHDGILATADEDIIAQWKLYLNDLLNEANPINADLESEPVEGPIRMIDSTELENAIKLMKNGKAAGPSGLTSDIIKASGKKSMEVFNSICEKMWNIGTTPPEWLSSLTVPIYKGKEDALECSSYRGIRLLEHSLKILERIIFNRLTNMIRIGEYQFGFLAGKSTIDAIFIMRQLQEKYRMKNKQLHHIFIDRPRESF